MNDILEAIRQKANRLEELRREVAQLEDELRTIRDAASGRKQTRAPRAGSRHGSTNGTRSRPIQKGSSVWWSKQVLDEAGSALHIDDIIRHINEFRPEGPEIKKATLVSNLSRYVSHNNTFTRPEPSTFGLIEYSNRRFTEGNRNEDDVER